MQPSCLDGYSARRDSGDHAGDGGRWFLHAGDCQKMKRAQYEHELLQNGLVLHLVKSLIVPYIVSFCADCDVALTKKNLFKTKREISYQICEECVKQCTAEDLNFVMAFQPCGWKGRAQEFDLFGRCPNHVRWNGDQFDRTAFSRRSLIATPGFRLRSTEKVRTIPGPWCVGCGKTSEVHHPWLCAVCAEKQLNEYSYDCTLCGTRQEWLMKNFYVFDDANFRHEIKGERSPPKDLRQTRECYQCYHRRFSATTQTMKRNSETWLIFLLCFVLIVVLSNVLK